MRLSTKVLGLAALCGTAIAAPKQKPIQTTADPEFPIPQPLPENGTLPGVDYELIARLKNAPNMIARIAMLKDEDFKFDYINPPKDNPFAQLKGRGGTIVNAFSFSMPALVGNNMGLSVAFTEPW